MNISRTELVPFSGISEEGQLTFNLLNLFKEGLYSFWEWNPATNSLVAPHFFEGNTLEDWIIRIHPRDQADYSLFLDRLTEEDNGKGQITFRVRKDNGNEWITLRQSMDATSDSASKTLCCLLEIVQDSSSQTTALEQLELSSRKELLSELGKNQHLASLGKLAGGIAHDFNNVLTVIQGHLMLLEQSLRDPNKENDQGESIELLKEAADQAAGLATQLLRAGAETPSCFELCDLNGIIENFVTMVSRMVEESIELEVDLDSDIGLIDADSVMIGQVLMNLILNARDALPVAGGKITIRTNAASFDRDKDDDATEFIELVISDNGAGIPKDLLPSIFTPYVSTKNRGSGLGLASVAGIVEEHGGTIDVESSSKGTTFSILLPSNPRPASPASQAAASPRPAPAPRKKTLEGTRILLVEDESAVRMLVRKLLEMLGCSVIEAETGRKALELWPEIRDEVTLVVSDVVMPEGVSGWDLARELRKSRPDVGILLTSGYCENPKDHNMGDDSHVAFLQKPYESGNLETTLSALLEN